MQEASLNLWCCVYSTNVYSMLWLRISIAQQLLQARAGLEPDRIRLLHSWRYVHSVDYLVVCNRLIHYLWSPTSHVP